MLGSAAGLFSSTRRTARAAACGGAVEVVGASCVGGVGYWEHSLHPREGHARDRDAFLLSVYCHYAPEIIFAAEKSLPSSVMSF